jgi:hypothetical protein
MCGPHNRYLAELEYGREKMARYWRSTRAESDGGGKPSESGGKANDT